MTDVSRHGMLGDQRAYRRPPGRHVRAADGRLPAARAVLSPFVRADVAVGLCMSAFFNSRGISDRILRVQTGVHLNTVAPAGRGKSVSVLIPNLLSYPGSCVIFDPAGELYEASAAHRAKTFGHKNYPS